MHHEPNAASFFNGFAETFDTIYDQKRNIFMRWVDCTFRSDMFIRYSLTFKALGASRGATYLDVGCGSAHTSSKRSSVARTGLQESIRLLTC